MSSYWLLLNMCHILFLFKTLWVFQNGCSIGRLSAGKEMKLDRLPGSLGTASCGFWRDTREFVPSMGSHRVGHDWSDLAAAAVVTWSALGQTVVISWRRDKEQVLAQAGAVVGDQETGADSSKLLGTRRTNESELVKSREKRASKK